MKDFRIKESKVIGLDEESLFWEVIKPIWPSSEEEDTIEYVSQGTQGQQAIFSVTLFIREVDNGGLEQFLTNTSGKYINMILKGLDLLKAKKHLKVLKKAIKIFPDSVVPLEYNERNLLLEKQLEKLNLSENDYFERYNDKLYGEENLYKYFKAYIKNNRNDFFK